MRENTAETITKEYIIEGYKDYCLRAGVCPPSIYRLCKYLQIDRETFYRHYYSLRQVETDVWLELLSKIMDCLHTSPDYAAYSVREKMLAFYFTLFQTLQQEPDHWKAQLASHAWGKWIIGLPEAFRSAFLKHISVILQHGIQTNEIADRPVWRQYYDDVCWLQCLFLLNFWYQDVSESYSLTDAAVEKSTHLIFDMLGKNAMDTSWDFFRFLIQHYRINS